jgi:hypothetical protein
MKRKLKKRSTQALKRAMYTRIIVICVFGITVGTALAKTTIDIAGESGIILAIAFMMMVFFMMILVIRTTPLEGEDPESKREKKQSWLENFIHDEDRLR